MNGFQRAIVLGVVVVVSMACAARGENYAILFCGGASIDQNWMRYYNTTNWMHTALVDNCNYLPENIWVLASDGLDPADDRQTGNWGSPGTTNSDWTTVTGSGSTVLSATEANLNTAIASMGMTSRDTFFFWSFDHGDGDEDPAEKAEEELCGWNENITATDLPTIIDAVAAERQAFVFAQCYAGGMLDELDMGQCRKRYGCAATNHYETAKWYPGILPAEGFARSFSNALENGYSGTHELFDETMAHAPNCTEGSNADTETTGPATQNPWDTGDDFDISVADWTGDQNGAWDNTLNWSWSVIPEPTRTVRINPPRPCILDALVEECYSIVMTENSEMNLAAGSELDVTGDVENYNGNIVISDGSLTVSYSAVNLGSLSKIGIGTSGEMSAASIDNEGELNTAGQLQVTGNAINRNLMKVHNSGDATIGNDLTVATSATLTVQDNGSTCMVMHDLLCDGQVDVKNRGTLTSWNDIKIGLTGNAAVSVDDATLYADGRILIGSLAPGSLICSKGTVTCPHTISVGENYDAGFEIAGTEVTTEYMHIGKGTGTYGTVLINVSGTFSPWVGFDGGGRTMKVGIAGSGEVAQYAGTVTRADADGPYPTIRMAEDYESSGKYTLHGGSIHVVDLRVGNNGTATFNHFGGDVTVDNFLYFGGDSTHACVYILEAGTLKVNQVLKGAASQGQLEINGGTLDLTGPSIDVYNLYIANQTGNSADLVLAGKSVSAENFHIGRSGPSGVGTYDYDGGTTTVNGVLAVGYTGDGTMIQRAGTTTAGDVNIGQGTDDHGIYTIYDGTLVVSNTLSIGYYGTSQMTIDSLTASVTTVDLDIGHYTQDNYLDLVDGDVEATGTMRLGTGTSGKGTFRHHAGDATCGTMIVGDAGEGFVRQSSGLQVVTGTLTVGNTGTGDYKLDNGRLETGEMIVGEMGIGTFTHTLGKHIVSGEFYLARNPGSQGTYDLQGGELIIQGNISIGAGGIGLLLVNGAPVNNGGSPGMSYVYAGSSIEGHGVFDKPIDNSGQLLATGGTLVLKQPYTGIGTVSIDPGATLDLQDDATIGGTMTNSGALIISSGTTQLAADMLATSTGNIVVPAPGHFDVQRQVAGTDMVCSGVLEHSGASTVVLTNVLVLNGQYRMTDPGAKLEVVQAKVKGLFDQQQGQALCSTMHIGNPGPAAAYDVGAGTLEVADLHVGQLADGTDAPGALNLTDASSVVVVSSSYTLHALGSFSAVPGAQLVMTGSAFGNYCTDPLEATGFNNLDVIYEGGNAHLDTLEVAGVELGAHESGFDGNFALDTLHIGRSGMAQVVLVDDYDNCPAWGGSESLYVHKLILEPGASLDLGGLNLYCHILDDGGAAIDYNGGSLVQFPPATTEGDIDSDGDVDATDLNLLLSSFSMPLTIQNEVDLDSLLGNYGRTDMLPEPGSSVPEPTGLMLILLALGTATVIRGQQRR